MRDREHQQAREREQRAAGQCERRRITVRVESDERLQYRGGKLVDERHDADLSEAQPEVGLEVRINRGQQRLHHVVEQVAEAHRENDRKHRVLGARRLSIGVQVQDSLGCALLRCMGASRYSLVARPATSVAGDTGPRERHCSAARMRLSRPRRRTGFRCNR